MLFLQFDWFLSSEYDFALFTSGSKQNGGEKQNGFSSFDFYHINRRGNRPANAKKDTKMSLSFGGIVKSYYSEKLLKACKKKQSCLRLF